MLPYVFPDPSPVPSGFDNINVYEIEINLSGDGDESKYIIIPGDVEQIVVSMFPSGEAKGNVYTSTDLYNKIKNDESGIEWIEWPRSWYAGEYQDYCPKVTALKFAQQGDGAIMFTARMQ